MMGGQAGIPESAECEKKIGESRCRWVQRVGVRAAVSEAVVVDGT